MQEIPGSIPGSGRSAGEGMGYPLQYSWASLVAGEESACNAGYLGSIHGLGRSPGEWKGHPSSVLSWRIHGVCSTRGRKESDTTERLPLLFTLCVSCLVMSDSVTPWTAGHQAPLSMEFSRQEYWSGLPCPSPVDIPDLGIEHGSSALQVDFLPLSHQGNPILCLSVQFSSVQSLSQV